MYGSVPTSRFTTTKTILCELRNNLLRGFGGRNMFRLENFFGTRIAVFTLALMASVGTARSAEWDWISDGLCNYCDQYAAGDTRDVSIKTTHNAIESPIAARSSGASLPRLDQDKPPFAPDAPAIIVKSAGWSWASDGLCNYCDQYTQGHERDKPMVSSYKPLIGFAGLSW
jgi:hypothetical protein